MLKFEKALVDFCSESRLQPASADLDRSPDLALAERRHHCPDLTVRIALTQIFLDRRKSVAAREFNDRLTNSFYLFKRNELIETHLASHDKTGKVIFNRRDTQTAFAGDLGDRQAIAKKIERYVISVFSV